MLLWPLNSFFEVMNVEPCPGGPGICVEEGMQCPPASEALVWAETWGQWEKGSGPWWCSLSSLRDGSQARVTLWDLYGEPQEGQEVLLPCYHAEKTFRNLRLLNCPGCNPSSPLKPSIPVLWGLYSHCCLVYPCVFPILLFTLALCSGFEKADFSSPKLHLLRGSCWGGLVDMVPSGPAACLPCSGAATKATHQTCPSSAVQLREEPAPGTELLCSLLCVCVCVCALFKGTWHHQWQFVPPNFFLPFHKATPTIPLSYKKKKRC